MTATHASPEGSPWPQRDPELTALWLWRGPEGERHSTAEIGRLMKLSKNALAKRAHRLGLARSSPVHRSEHPPSPQRRALPVARHTLPPLASER